MMTPLQTLQSRHSVRAFREEALSDTHVKKLKACITMINTHQQGLKFQLITNDPDPLAGFSKSYGVFTNARNYMAAVVDTATPDVLERAGYYAEQVVIKSCELGVGSCFVGGTYNESKVKAQLRAGEKVLFLVLLGYPAEKTKFMAKIMAKMVHLKRMDAEQFFEPSGDLTEAVGKFPFLTVGLEAVACAPPHSTSDPPAYSCAMRAPGMRSAPAWTIPTPRTSSTSASPNTISTMPPPLNVNGATARRSQEATRYSDRYPLFI